MIVNVNYPLPTVHLNGTSRYTLLQGEHRVHDAIQKVFDALGECEFHGRDYYVQDKDCYGLQASEGDGGYGNAYKRAVEERMKHIENLRAFQQYSLEHVMHLRDSE